MSFDFAGNFAPFPPHNTSIKKHGMTPFIAAAKSGHLHVLKGLVAMDANKELKTEVFRKCLA
jgi:hypothetical protein